MEYGETTLLHCGFRGKNSDKGMEKGRSTNSRSSESGRFKCIPVLWLQAWRSDMNAPCRG